MSVSSPPRRRILIAEDDAPSARTLARLLTEDGYQVETVFDGAQAIARLGRTPMPDALVVDYRLPHVDGLAVASYGRSRSARLAIIMVTSYPEVIARAKQTLDAPLVTLTKPLAYAELTGEIERLCAGVLPVA